MKHEIKESDTVWATIGAGVFAVFAFAVLITAIYFFLSLLFDTL